MEAPLWAWWERTAWELLLIVDSVSRCLRLLMISNECLRCRIILLWASVDLELTSKPSQPIWNKRSISILSSKTNQWSHLPSAISSHTHSFKKGTKHIIQIWKLDCPTHRRRTWKWAASPSKLWFNWCPVHDRTILMRWNRKWIIDGYLRGLL